MLEYKKLKYCLISNNTDIADNKFSSIGIYQWLKIFNGKLCNIRNILPILKDGLFDIIHIPINENNYKLIKLIRNKIGINSKTKIISSFCDNIELWINKIENKTKFKDALNQSDLNFATEYLIVKYAENNFNCKVFEIPHPADIKKIKSLKKTIKKKHITVFINSNTILNIRKFLYYGLKIKIITPNKSLYNKYLNLKIQSAKIYLLSDEKEYIKHLLETKFLYYFNYIPDYGKYIIYAAIIGIPVISRPNTDAQRRCFPIPIIKNNNLFYLKWKIEDSFKHYKYISEYAINKAEYYNYGNSFKKLIDFIYDKTLDNKFLYDKIHKNYSFTNTSYSNNLIHIYGKKTINYSIDEFIVICLVKNGELYLNSFIKYYKKLGAKHIFFIDDNSTDNTKKIISEYNNTSIYTSKLSYTKYQNEIRNSLIYKICKNRWCLCVDVDEFFEYPKSDIIPMKELLTYLNNNKYTTLIANMLDLLYINDKNTDFINSSIYYNLTNIKKIDYFIYYLLAFNNYNKLSNKNIKFYYGGIRKKIFSGLSNYHLTKHPLVFIDHKIEPFTDAHYCNKAHVADFTGVLKHYKLIPSLLNKVKKIKNTNDYSYFGKIEHGQYYKYFKKHGKLNIDLETIKKYNNVNELIDNRFIVVSQKYLKYVNTLKYHRL